MKQPKFKKITVPGVSIWPQPKKSTRQRYRISYGPKGKRQTIIASTDMETTVEMAMRISRQREQRRTGIVNAEDYRFQEQDRRPIDEHLADWTRAMRSSALGDKHVNQFSGYARDVLIGSKPLDPGAPRGRGRARGVSIPTTGWTRISEIVASRVRNQVGAVKHQTTGATANRYLDAVTAFLNWGVADTRWAKNPCQHLERYNAKLDRKRPRRVLAPLDLVKLLEATEKGPIRGTLTGRQRSLVYRVCLAAALRGGEATKLPVHDAKLEGDKPGLWVSEKVGKNKRRRHFIPISASLAAELKAGAQGKKPTDPLMVVPTNPARVIKLDLEAAGIDYETAEGVFDFHALRHECGALMISAGASPKAVQEHMRHASIRMTLDTYGHLMPEDREQARRRLPEFDEAARALLTKPVQTSPEKAQRNAQRQIGINCRDMSPFVAGSAPVKELDMSLKAEKQGIRAMEPRGIEPRFAECDSENRPAEAKSHPEVVAGPKPKKSATRSAKGAATNPRRYYRFRGRVVQRVPRALPSGGRLAAEVKKLVGELLEAAARHEPPRPPTSM